MNTLLRQAFSISMLLAIYSNSHEVFAQQNPTQGSSVVASQPTKNRLTEIQAEMRALCKSAALAPYFNKTPCSTNEMTADHFNDRSKVTAEEKIALNKAAQLFGDLFNESNNILRARDFKSQQIVKYRETVAIPAQNKVRLDLAEGKISWGEYNKRRKEINDGLQAEQKRIYSNLIADSAGK
jgi:hypothetical protein